MASCQLCEQKPIARARPEVRPAGFHDGAVTSGARVAIMSDEQVSDESVDFSVSLAIHFKIFADGYVSGEANPLCLEERRGGLAFQSFEFFANKFLRHGVAIVQLGVRRTMVLPYHGLLAVVAEVASACDRGCETKVSGAHPNCGRTATPDCRTESRG
jgi:hypothetical protein